MCRLLEDLLATARKRSAAFVDREVDLAGLARDVGRGVPAAGGRAIRCGWTCGWRPVRSSTPTRSPLDRALSNLLSNAVRLAPAGSTVTVAIGSRAGLGLDRRPRRGPGHPGRAAQPHLRPVLARGPAKPSEGSGLGLAIARQIVESHDGRLVLAERRGRAAPSSSGCPSAPSPRANASRSRPRRSDRRNGFGAGKPGRT